MKESELCAEFRTAAESDGWIVYPEVEGWDLVLVWSGEAPVPQGAYAVQEGDQVAVEAKLRANVQALRQAATRSTHAGYGRPNFRAVLAPNVGEDFKAVAAMLGVGTYSLRHCGPWVRKRNRYSHDMERKIVAAPHAREASKNRIWLPPIVSSGPAGEACPRSLTPWRVMALRMMVLIRTRWVTRLDFKAIGISPQLWTQSNWIIPVGREGRRTLYGINPKAIGLPDEGWEAERDALTKGTP